MRPSEWHKDGWWEDKNQRCGIGGFAVKKMGTCNEFTGKSNVALSGSTTSSASPARTTGDGSIVGAGDTVNTGEK